MIAEKPGWSPTQIPAAGGGSPVEASLIAP
jgi:hypothetical protein